MLDLEDCRVRARQLIVLANATDSEAERAAYYELAQPWLARIAGLPGLQAGSQTHDRIGEA